jgi:uncharacterized protein DUF6812
MIASTSSMAADPIQRPVPMADTHVMHYRRERVRIETQRHEIEGTVQLPSEGYRSRTTDFLNAHERDFLALTDVELRWLDATRAPERHDYLAVAVPHIVLALELETLGIVDDTGGAPAPAPLAAVSTPPPLD